MAALLFKDASLWLSLSPFLDGDIIRNLIISGDRTLLSLLARRRSFSWTFNRETTLPYPSLKRVFSVIEHYIPSLQSFSFDTAGLEERVITSDLVNHGPTLKSLLHLKLDFVGSLSSFFRQKQYDTVWPLLQTLYLRDFSKPKSARPSHNTPIHFGDFPATLKSLTIISDLIYFFDYQECAKLPIGLENLHLDVPLDDTRGPTLDLSLPPSITRLLLQHSLDSKFSIFFSSLPLQIRSLTIIGRNTSVDTASNATPSSIVLQGIDRLTHLQHLIMRKTSVNIELLPTFPPSIERLECNFVSSANSPLPTLQDIAILKSFTFISSKIAKCTPFELLLLTNDHQSPYQPEFLDWRRGSIDDFPASHLPDSLTHIKAMDINCNILPNSLTCLRSGRLEKSSDLSPSLVASGSLSHPPAFQLPEKLIELSLRNKLCPDFVAVLPPTLQRLTASLQDTTWNLICDAASAGKLPDLVDINSMIPLPAALLCSLPRSLSTLSYAIAAPIDDPANLLTRISNLAEHPHLRNLSLHLDWRSSFTLRSSTLDRASYTLLLNSLPKQLLQVNVNFPCPFLEGIHWPDSLRIIRLSFHHEECSRDLSFCVSETNTLVPTFATLPKLLRSLTIMLDLQTLSKGNIALHPDFPQYLAHLSTVYEVHPSENEYFAKRGFEIIY